MNINLINQSQILQNQQMRRGLRKKQVFLLCSMLSTASSQEDQRVRITMVSREMDSRETEIMIEVQKEIIMPDQRHTALSSQDQLVSVQ